MNRAACKFFVGQVVHHLLFDYRGVVVDVDATFQGSDGWYESVARSRPPKDLPWYHVLVGDAGHATYVAERHLEPDDSGAPIDHPLLERVFSEFRDGVYVARARVN